MEEEDYLLAGEDQEEQNFEMEEVSGESLNKKRKSGYSNYEDSVKLKKQKRAEVTKEGEIHEGKTFSYKRMERASKTADNDKARKAKE